MKPLSERLSDIRHARLELSPGTATLDTPCHRPEVSVMADADEGAPLVTVAISALFGQQQRFVSMHPLEARKLADMILEMTRAVEREIMREQASAAIDEETKRILEKAHATPERPASHTDAFGDQREYDDERQWGWSVS